MPRLVADQISCFDGGVEALIRGCFAGGVFGAVFYERPKIPIEPNVTRFYRIVQRLVGPSSRLRYSGRFAFAMGAWNCKNSQMRYVPVYSLRVPVYSLRVPVRVLCYCQV